jgi:hypothetical protein
MKQSQAQKRYQKSHPAVMIRLSNELKESLDLVRGKKTYPDVIRGMIQDAALMSITIPCVKCGKPIPILVNGAIHKGILALQKEEGKLQWEHEDCPE